MSDYQQRCRCRLQQLYPVKQYARGNSVFSWHKSKTTSKCITHWRTVKSYTHTDTHTHKAFHVINVLLTTHVLSSLFSKKMSGRRLWQCRQHLQLVQVQHKSPLQRTLQLTQRLIALFGAHWRTSTNDTLCYRKKLQTSLHSHHMPIDHHHHRDTTLT